MTTPAAALRRLIAQPVPPIVPLALDPLSAVTAEAAGFQALYLGGGTLGYVKTSTEAHLSLTQMCSALLEIRAACALPVILDGQCGWGDCRPTGRRPTRSIPAGSRRRPPRWRAALSGR